jgi:hypothetical protein
MCVVPKMCFQKNVQYLVANSPNGMFNSDQREETAALDELVKRTSVLNKWGYKTVLPEYYAASCELDLCCQRTQRPENQKCDVGCSGHF